MATTPTSNPVPSTAPQDLLFNAEKLDEVVNSAALDFTDRLGNTRATLAGISGEAAASIGGGIFVDVAAGLAATPEGRYFSVPAVDTDEYLILYRKVSGVQVEQKRYPSTEAVDAVNVEISTINGTLTPLVVDNAEHGSALVGLKNGQAAFDIDGSSIDLEWGVADRVGKVGLGIKRSGAVLAAGSEITPLGAQNSETVAWGIADTAGRVALAVGLDGSARVGTSTLKEIGENSLDVAWGIADSAGRLALGVTTAGEVLIPGSISAAQRGSLVVASGDIVLVQGDAVTELTDTGDNMAPTFVSDTQVKFVSTRRRGEFAEYTVGTSGADDDVRLYADTAVYEQVIITGQSLALGSANAAITTSEPFPDNAFRFSNGPVGAAAEQIVATIGPLREEVNETISTGFGRKLLTYALDRTILVSGQAYGGAAYADIKKGGTFDTYDRCIEQVEFGSALPGGAAVRALFVIHGEADGIAASTTYAADLVQWLDDYTDDTRVANGQTGGLVMLLCQVSSAAGYKDAATRDQFTTPFLQLQASETDPRIFMVCPKYFLTYTDYAHIDAVSERLLGEYYAKVYRKVVVQGEDWRPVSPESFNVVGSTVVIDFHVPVSPLVIDTTAVSDPGDFGFDLTNSGVVTLVSGALTGPAQITITLSAPPPAASVLSYAFHNGTFSSSGPTTGARGCLRDSDTDTSTYTGAALRNWCVSFKHTF